MGLRGIAPVPHGLYFYPRGPLICARVKVADKRLFPNQPLFLNGSHKNKLHIFGFGFRLANSMTDMTDVPHYPYWTLFRVKMLYMAINRATCHVVS